MSKVMVITGGSAGIGAATVEKALLEGYLVVASARNQEKLDQLKNKMNNPNLEVFSADVSEYEQLKALREFTLQKFGKVNIVFANAGFTSGSTSYLEGQTPDEWKEMVLANVYGAAITANIFLSELVKTQGQLIFTGSVIGRVAATGRLYSATKWAVTGMADSIRKEMVGKGVRVTLIEPGMVETEFWSEGTNFAISLKPEDVAETVIFTTKQPKHVDINEILIRPIGQGI
jgi:NADP-dependent 3-hydroxy acid dehydrogenase YdfG